MEQYTRHKINKQLTNLGWILDGYRKNVFQEEPRTKEERRRLDRLRPDYVLYASNSDRYEPLAIIEAKTYKTKGLYNAIEQAEDYAHALKAPIIFATDGVYFQTRHVVDKKSLIYNGEEVNNLVKEEIALGFLENHVLDTRPREVKISQESLISVFKDINNLLRKNGLSAGHERFSEFATILFLKLFSEREKREDYRGLDQIYSWEHLKNLPSKSLLKYLSHSIFPNIAKLYQDKNIFDCNLKITDNRIFKQIHDKLEALQLSYINEDIKGNAFEYFIANAPSASKDLGEYFTPRHIVKAMVSMLDPRIEEKVYDPFCGTGGMLIQAYKHIYNTMELNASNIEKLKKDTLYGREITSNARIAKMNMILAGDGHNQIKQGDSLAPDNLQVIKGKFDVVITNFPFSQDTDHYKAYPVPITRGDSICLQHCIESLKQGGRMAVVVPEGVLFRKDLRGTRQYLLEHCHINYIISLPKGVFEPYTGVKTNILHCTKKKATSKVWFYEVKQDGFSLDKRRRKLNQRSDLNKFLSFARIEDEDKSNFGFIPIEVERIKEKDYSLNLNDYITQDLLSKSQCPMVKLGEIVDFVRGVTYDKKDQSANKTAIQILTADNISLDGHLNVRKIIYLKEGFNIQEKKRLNKGDIFICTSSGSKKHLGKVAYVGNNTPYFAGGFMGLLKIRNPNKIIPKYVYYLLDSFLFKREIDRRIVATSIYNIGKAIFDFCIPIPPLEEQKKIIDELESYQNVIDSANKMVEFYKPYINVKEEWQIVRLGTICKCYQPKIITKKEIEESLGEHKVYGANGVVGHFHDYNHENEQVIVGCRGQCGAVKFTTPKSWITSNAMVCEPRVDYVSKKYLYYVFSTLDMSNIIIGSAQQQITKPSIENLLVPLPPLEEQKKIVQKIEQEEAIIAQNQILIEMMKKKVQNKMNSLWQESKKPPNTHL